MFISIHCMDILLFAICPDCVCCGGGGDIAELMAERILEWTI